MRPGQVYLDHKFLTRDGVTLAKYCVVLAAKDNNTYLVLKSTSKFKNYPKTPGCNIDPIFTCFFVPEGSEASCFPLDTWIQLDEIYPMCISQISPTKIDKNISLKGILSSERLKKLLNCTTHSEDINSVDLKLLNKVIQTIS